LPAVAEVKLLNVVVPDIVDEPLPSKVTIPERAVKVSELDQFPATLIALFSPSFVSRIPPVIVRLPFTSRASSSSKVASLPPSLKVILLKESPPEVIVFVPDVPSKVTVLVFVPEVNVPLFDQFPPTLNVPEVAFKVAPEAIVTAPLIYQVPAALVELNVPA